MDTIVSNATTSCPQSSRQAVSTNQHVVKLTNIPIRHPASEQLDSIHDYNSSFEDDTRPIRAIVATSDRSATNQQSRKASQQRFDRVEDKTECDNHDSTMGLAPIIYKTQEWTIHEVQPCCATTPAHRQLWKCPCCTPLMCTCFSLGFLLAFGLTRWRQLRMGWWDLNF